jgi:hypothetical protein
MYFKNDLIDSIAIEYDKIVSPGYLSSFIRELREKHKYLPLDCYNEPEFLLHGNFIKSQCNNLRINGHIQRERLRTGPFLDPIKNLQL